MDLKPISIPHHNSLSIHFGYQEPVLPVYLISHFLTRCLGDGACHWAFLPALFPPSSPPAWCLLPLWTEAHWPGNVTPCWVLSALLFPSSGPQRLSSMPWSPQTSNLHSSLPDAGGGFSHQHVSHRQFSQQTLRGPETAGFSFPVCAQEAGLSNGPGQPDSRSLRTAPFGAV